MKTTFLSQNNPNLLVYFAGWGTPGSEVSHLVLPPDYDLLICCDYRDFCLDFDFSHYRRIRLVAWSMGVWVAEQIMNNISLISATAINGTALPCHDTYGIPVAVFSGTLNNLNETTRSKFVRRMCGDQQNFNQYQQLEYHRQLNEIHAELTALYRTVAQTTDATDKIRWTKAVIGTQDRIFPPEHQQAYWQNRCPIQYLEKNHYLFAGFKCWEQLWT